MIISSKEEIQQDKILFYFTKIVDGIRAEIENRRSLNALEPFEKCFYTIKSYEELEVANNVLAKFKNYVKEQNKENTIKAEFKSQTDEDCMIRVFVMFDNDFEKNAQIALEKLKRIQMIVSNNKYSCTRNREETPNVALKDYYSGKLSLIEEIEKVLNEF